MSAEDTTSFDDYMHKRSDCFKDDVQSSYDCVNTIDVEIVEKAITKLNRGKACGPDDLSAEHLFYAHPLLIVHIKNFSN